MPDRSEIFGSLSEYAKHRGCSPAYVSKLKAEGRLVFDAVSGKVDFSRSDARIAASADPSRERPSLQRRAEQALGGDRRATCTVEQLVDLVGAVLGRSFTDAVVPAAGDLAHRFGLTADEGLEAARIALLALWRACEGVTGREFADPVDELAERAEVIAAIERHREQLATRAGTVARGH